MSFADAQVECINQKIAETAHLWNGPISRSNAVYLVYRCTTHRASWLQGTSEVVYKSIEQEKDHSGLAPLYVPNLVLLWVVHVNAQVVCRSNRLEVLCALETRHHQTWKSSWPVRIDSVSGMFLSLHSKNCHVRCEWRSANGHCNNAVIWRIV